MRIKLIQLHFWPQDSDWILALFNAPDDIEDRIQQMVDEYDNTDEETSVVQDITDYLDAIGVGYLMPEIDVIEIGE